MLTVKGRLYLPKATEGYRRQPKAAEGYRRLPKADIRCNYRRLPLRYAEMFTYVTLMGLPENRKTPRRTPQDATDRCKTPQNAYSHETPMYYGMFYTLMYELETVSIAELLQNRQHAQNP